MQAWLLRGEQSDETEALGSVLRQWAARPENAHWTLDSQRVTPELTALIQARRPEVLVLAEPSCPAGSWTTEALVHGAGMIVATSLEGAESYRVLAEQHAIHLTVLPSGVEQMGLAILSVLSSLHRQHCWQARIDQLQQRLNDRIIIERAKGILVQRLGISEKEAYKRLRVLSRRQRRQIRDIAQSLLDTQSLLMPELNGFTDSPRRDEEPPVDRCGTAPGIG
jgi:AmiR/NasT family two-component response regulator